MSFVNRLWGELFPENNPSQKKKQKEVLLRETIERNEVFLRDYRGWIVQQIHFGLLAHLDELRIKRDQTEKDNISEINFYRHSESASEGIYFHGEAPWNNMDYTYLIHYFVDQLKLLGYSLSNTQREVLEEHETLKMRERFYLKPALKYRGETPQNQLFGNVHIEHHIRDEQTVLVKFMVFTYSDRSFQPPLNFQTLLNRLFKVPST